MTEKDVEPPAQANAEPQTHSSAELALEISRLVSRALSGETIDTALSGAALAARFPEAGMSGEMIAQAIERATGMVGMIRDGKGADAPNAPETAGAEGSDTEQATDAALAAAIDAELSDLVGAPMPEASLLPTPDAEESQGEQPSETEGDAAAARGRGLFGRIAAMRRVFSRG